MEGGTTFHFVTDGIESALAQARAAAGDGDVQIAGGADVIQQYLKAGVVDEFQVTVAPKFLGGGVRLFDGLGNEDVFTTDHDGGFVGMSFRFFDPERQRWSIYWADSRRPGELDPPVVGRFEGDVGVFEGEDVLNGRPILVRFTWSRQIVPPICIVRVLKPCTKLMALMSAMSAPTTRR
jgi:hypothetical protein